MPNAHGHDLITVVTGVVLMPPVYTYFNQSNPSEALIRSVIVLGAHLISGIMFSPDLDLDSAIDDRWGAFGWIWRPYTMLIPHRHFWSHGLILPPLLRLGYFFGVLMLLLFGIARGMAAIDIVIPDYHERLAHTLIQLYTTHPTETYAFLFGFMTGGAVHTIADWLVTGGKHYLHMFGFRPRRSYTNHDQSIHRH